MTQLLRCWYGAAQHICFASLYKLIGYLHDSLLRRACDSWCWEDLFCERRVYLFADRAVLCLTLPSAVPQQLLWQPAHGGLGVTQLLQLCDVAGAA